MKSFTAMLITIAICFFELTSFAASGYVRIISVNKVVWRKVQEKKDKTSSTLGWSAGGLYFLGPVGALAGAAIGSHRGEDEKDSSQIEMHGFKIKLSNGETINTLVKYKVGQLIQRNEIDEERN